MNIEKLIHISDIHIRNFKRQTEYINVFKNLFKVIKNNIDEKTAIVLAGDIVHSKNEMTPELVIMVSTLLRNCADIAPTILILGNHDINLNNENRLDALTPIVNTLRHPNLYYWKDTNVYELGNVSFSVYSILGSINDWITADKIKNNNIKVALHHGAVNNAITDLDHIILNDAVKLNVFDGFDAVLLGDIHKLQTLQEYSNINNKKKPLIKYSSSLVQQNYGETIDKHGILIWDLINHTSEFIEIENEIGYVTIEVDESKIITPKEEFNNFPNKLRLRIKYKNTNYNDLQKIITLLKKKYTILEIVRKKIPNTIESDITKIDIVGNVRDVEYQNQLLNTYILENYTQKIDIDSLRHINRVINSKIELDSIPLRNVIWKPIEFEFTNMFSYGENNKINFSEYNGILGIFAKNASGKTSFLNSLTFCLFDKSPTAWKATDILNINSNNFKCKLHLIINDESYYIERNAVLNERTDNVKVNVNFYKIVDGETISLNGDDRDGTNKNIRNYIGTYDDFLMTAFSSQVDNKNIIFKSQRERKDLMNSFLDITIFEKLYIITRDEIKEKQTRLKLLGTQYDIDSIDKNNILIQNYTNNKLKLIDEKDSINKLIISLNAEIKELNSLIYPTNEIYDIDLINSNIDILNHNIKSKNELVKKLNRDIKISDKLLTTYENKLSKFDIDEIENSEKINQQLRLDLIHNNNDISKIDIKINHLNGIISKLDEHEYNPDCEFCISNQFVVQAKEASQEIKGILKQKELLIERDLNIIKSIDSNNSLLYLYNEYKDIFKEYSNELSNNQDLSNKLEITKSSIDNLKLNLDINRNNKKLYNKQKTIQYKNSQYREEINKKEKDLELLLEELNKNQSKIEVLTTQLIKLNHTNDEIINVKKQIEQLNSDLFLYEIYLNSISKDGIPSIIIKRILPILQEEINNILSNIVEFNILLESDEKNINIYIQYPEGRKYLVELSSGMERFITSIATRVALMNISSIPKPNFIAIDEGFGVADSDMINLFPTLFGVLKTEFDLIICISHLDVIRDMVDTSINITKIGVGEKTRSQIV